MKRISFAVLFIFFSIFFSRAQFRVAFVGGGHQSKVLEDNNLPGWDSLKKNYTGRNGVHFGFMADLPFSSTSHFYFQPSVLFYNKGRNYKSHPADTTVVFKRSQLTDSIVNTVYYQTRKYFINYIDIPINIVYKFRLNKKASFMIGGGPYISLFYNGVDKKVDVISGVGFVSQENSDLPVGNGRGQYSTLDYGVNGLAGFEFGRVILTVNYSRGLKDFYQPADYTATNYKHEVMGATLGIFFGKPVPLAPKDTDGDGTPDQTDKCPDIAGPVKLLGCPDTDNDGITDAEDKCPGEAGPADNKGCPYTDRDGDKVLDKDDKCPDIAGPADNGGCPYPDRDKDGIIDKDDKCPEVAGLARYGGCPVPDTDGDGINDEEDKCPDKKGTKENKGCPEEIKKEIAEKVEYSAKRIQFIVNSAELSRGSFEVLDTVAAILKRNPGINVSIEGHTSSEGTYSANMKLSESRANKVKDYLLSGGVEASRLKTVGFGPGRLLNADKTPEEKVKNRRVELKLSN
jgi:outer membrane protein OmpA-like peptidoglycan-associated protein